MKLVNAFLSRIGDEGFPKGIDTSLEKTWSLYQLEQPKTTWDRVLSVLGFFYLVHQAGMHRYIEGKSDAATIYKSFRLEEFAENATVLSKQFVKYHIFDVLRVFKSKFEVVSPIRGDIRILRLDLALVPRRTEHLDGCLTRLGGLLYNGDVPKQLSEVWKKLPVKSTAKHKSALPKYTARMASDSTLGWLLLDIVGNSTIYATRAAGDMLILRITTKVAATPVQWLGARKHDELLRQLYTSAFSKLKG